MVKIWDKFSGGDKQVYTKIFKEFYGSLVVYARRLVNDRDVAEDIVQGFFCYLWENRQRLSSAQLFETYLYSSVRNRCLNYIRDKHIVPIEGVEVGEEESLLLGIMEEEIYRELYAAIRKLPDKCSQTMLLKLSGKKNPEIAHELDISEETVRSQLRRGRELLQKNLSSLLSLTTFLFLFRDL